MPKTCRPASSLVRAIAISFCFTASAQAEPDGWSEMLDEISTGVVSLKIDLSRSFDTERNQTTQATGFIVDAERGIILTNRHVVTPAPVRAEALFLNQEEVRVTPIYRDPVHDFGFFKYDPADLRYIKPAQLKLAPERATVGLEVRVVGNDAGEQLSILSGTIARLDRKAPGYGYGQYNDFNTFYIQAASGSSGGSSGSPVLDRRGNVVALNAGASSSAASSFFLPLNRVKRALELLQQGKPVSRGTLQTRFERSAYDELSRLGLMEATEARYRGLFPGQTGMLVVSNIIRQSPAAAELQIGDILLSINGQPLIDFVTLEDVLDNSVGATIALTLERNGQQIDRRIQVSDLHAISPDNYIGFGDAVVHQLSYQQAWHVNKPLKGVYVASPGYVFGTAGVPRQSVIEKLDGQTVSDLDEFEGILANLADGEEAVVGYYTIEDPNGVDQAIMRMDRRWFPAERCFRDDATGTWPCRTLESATAPEEQRIREAVYIPQADRVLQKISQSLVLVNFDMPFAFSGVSDQHYYGTGLVIDAEQGLVVVDRNTVPIAMGDVRLTFAGSVQIPGRVEYVHPLHNIAILSYSPELLGATPVLSAVFNTREQEAGDSLRAVGMRPDNTVVGQSVKVASTDPLSYPLSRTMRFRESNLEAISLVSPPRGFDGVLADKRARVVALWSSFAYDSGSEVYQENKGLPIEIVEEALADVRSRAQRRSLEAELLQLPLTVARSFGLPDAWVDRLVAHSPQRRQVLSVARTVAGTSAAELLRPGDLLLAIDDQVVNRFREVEKAAQNAQLRLTIWRDGAEAEVLVQTQALDSRGVRRLVGWSGALLQAPYRDMAAQRGIEPIGVYVAFYNYGSPASRAGLNAGSRIVKVNGQPVADLDEFLALVVGHDRGDSVRLTTRSWNDSVRVITVKPDEVFWPTWEVIHNGDWKRRELGDAASIPAAESAAENSDGRQ